MAPLPLLVAGYSCSSCLAMLAISAVGRVDGDAGFADGQSRRGRSDCRGRMTPGVVRIGIRAERQEDVFLPRDGESSRQHADHGDRRFVEHDAAADRLGRAAELALPEAVAHDRGSLDAPACRRRP